jgi:hypothetical protein
VIFQLAPKVITIEVDSLEKANYISDQATILGANCKVLDYKG